MAQSSGGTGPAPTSPAELGATGDEKPAVGDGGVVGNLVAGPKGRVERYGTATVRWTGASGGVDRPADTPFLLLERKVKGAWKRADTDLGLAFFWREDSGNYGATYDVSGNRAPGQYRLRVLSGKYQLATHEFTVERSTKLRVRGVKVAAARGGSRLTVVAQNPPPDPLHNLLWRPRSPSGGRAVLHIGDHDVSAGWDAKRHGWVALVRPAVAAGTSIVVKSLADRYGNHLAEPISVKAGEIAKLDWPPNMGVGGGRTPGPFGQGTFPP
jgi:hypothetical protein